MNTSRKILLAGGAAVVASAMASSALAQASATTSASASVTIFQPISISKGADLSFGRIIRPSTGTNTVAVDEATGARTLTGGGNGAVAGGTVTRATFTASGEGGQAINVTFPTTLNLATGVDVNFTHETVTALGGTIGSTGSATFGVGGNVTLDSSAATGNFSGSFNVTVAYQ